MTSRFEFGCSRCESTPGWFVGFDPRDPLGSFCDCLRPFFWNIFRGGETVWHSVPFEPAPKGCGNCVDGVVFGGFDPMNPVQSFCSCEQGLEAAGVTEELLEREALHVYSTHA